MSDHLDGWRNLATREVADGIRDDPVLLLETLDRINHLAGGQSLEELSREAGNVVAAAWFCQEPMPPRREDVDWVQLGESFLVQLLKEGPELGP